MNGFAMSRCRSCNAEIVWATTLIGGKAMPVDPTPSPDGNLLLAAVDPDDASAGYAAIMLTNLTDEARASAERAAVVLHESHFATCPNADQHRKSAASGPTMPWWAEGSNYSPNE